MTTQLFTPIAEIKNESLVRRSGLFYREKIKLLDICRVVAVVKDAVTYEEIVVVFFDVSRARVYLSEFDKNFSQVMDQLQYLLPGLSTFSELIVNRPFDRDEIVLWER